MRERLDQTPRFADPHRSRPYRPKSPAAKLHQSKEGWFCQPPVKVVVSYSHVDERMRDHLGHHLAAMEQQGLIEIWYDRMIDAADDWEAKINRKIAAADVILLLISASFIRSPNCQKELQDALKLRNRRKSLPVPILLRPCDWESVFNQPGYKGQALPRDNRSVAGGTWPNHDAAFAVIARELRSLFERLQGLA
jgi:TIR domain